MAPRYTVHRHSQRSSGLPGQSQPEGNRQGRIGLEILEELDAFDELVVPVGGGGLIAGVAVAVKARRPSVRVIGVQTEQFPSAIASRQAGMPISVPAGDTIADGIAVERTGDLPFDLMQRYVDDLVTASEADIQRAKLLAEGAGAVPLAAILSGAIAARGRRIVLLLSGGNVDLGRFRDVLAEP